MFKLTLTYFPVEFLVKLYIIPPSLFINVFLFVPLYENFIILT
jgi:hypothetical protein